MVNRSAISQSSIIVIIAGLLVNIGCNTDNKKYVELPVVPAKGKIVYKGKPIAGAKIVFVPANDDSQDSVKPSARVADDGSYELITYPSASGKPDGAPPGDYLVSVRWTTRPKKSAEDADEGGPPGLPGGVQPDRLGEKYSNPKSSGIKVKVEASKDIELIDLK